MNPWIDVVIVVACLAASALYSGCETALYTVSRARIDLEAQSRSLGAKLAGSLVRRDTVALVTILIGNNLMIEIMTLRSEALAGRAGLPSWAEELLLSLVLTPVVFFFAEVLPKDLFRRRPHDLLRLFAPFVWISRWVYLPLERVLTGFVALLTRALGLSPSSMTEVIGRESLAVLLREGTQSGVLPAHAEQLARNVLKLRTIEVERCMIPWKQAITIREGALEADRYAAVARSVHTRLPVVDGKGAVRGYVHQLDVLGSGPEVAVLEHLRPMTVLPARIPVDRALARLRAAGQRIAVVGTAEKPLGIVTLKDLLEEISGDLAGW